MLINDFVNSSINTTVLHQILAAKTHNAHAVLNLSGSDFQKIKLPSLELIGDSLRSVDLSYCKVDDPDTRVVLTGSDLTRSLFVHSKMPATNFEKTILDGVDFNNALMDFARFKAAKGCRIIFHKTQLLVAMFSGVVMPRADFSEAVLNGATFNMHSQLERVSFVRATMNYVHIEDIEAGYNNFEKVNAFKLIIKKSQLSQGSFDGAQLIDSKFLEVKLICTTFRGGKLTEVDFSGSNLTDVDFSGCILERCVFDKAKLEGTLFGDAIFIDTDTSGENFKAANWESTKKEEK